MKTSGFVLLCCLLPAALCWDFPGYPGVDCPTARQKMSDNPNDPKSGWMLPKCFADGTYQPLQCYDYYLEYPDSCMCCLPDGGPLTLPGFGLNVKVCDCFLEQYKNMEHDEDDETPKCEKDGTYAPLQCDKITKKCWCVDKKGNILVPPSTDVHSCDNSIE